MKPFISYITAARTLANYCDWADRRIEELEIELSKYRKREDDNQGYHTDYDGMAVRNHSENAFHCINGGEGK